MSSFNWFKQEHIFSFTPHVKETIIRHSKTYTPVLSRNSANAAISFYIGIVFVNYKCFMNKLFSVLQHYYILQDQGLRSCPAVELVKDAVHIKSMSQSVNSVSQSVTRIPNRFFVFQSNHSTVGKVHFCQRPQDLFSKSLGLIFQETGHWCPSLDRRKTCCKEWHFLETLDDKEEPIQWLDTIMCVVSKVEPTRNSEENGNI